MLKTPRAAVFGEYTHYNKFDNILFSLNNPPAFLKKKKYFLYFCLIFRIYYYFPNLLRINDTLCMIHTSL